MSESLRTRKLGRRDFLKMAGAVSAGTVLAACAPQATATQAPASATQAPAAKTPVRIRAVSQMAVDQVNGFAVSIKDDLTAKGIELDIFQNPITSDWSGYADTLITQIAGGEQLDVLMIAIEGVALLGVKNILTDLEIPFSWNNMVLYYNTKIMKDEGITMPMHMTWDDFLGICQKVANVQGTAQDRYAYNFWSSGTFGWLSWLYMNDGQGWLTDDWKNSNLNNPKVAETIQFMADLVLKYKVAPNPVGWDEQGQFLAGNVVMRTCGRWCIAGLLQNNFTDYDLVYQPHKSGNVLTVAGTDGWGVTAQTKNPNEAFTVAAALSGSGPSLEMVKLGGNIPALRSVANMPEFASFGPSNTKIFYESLDGAKALQAPTNFNICEPIVNKAFAPIWNGEVSVADGLAKGHQELQAEMDKINQ
jgi:multiple sugar transport system substrate-binding protein